MNMQMIATITEGEMWILGCTILTALCAVAAVIIAILALNKKQEVRVDQPLEVQFAADFVPHKAFDKLVADNNREHENIFKKIGGVERGAGSALNQRLGEMQKAAEEGREKLHTRINRISIGVARLCGRLDVDMPAEEDEI